MENILSVKNLKKSYKEVQANQQQLICCVHCRADIARGLIHRSEILFLDEPTTLIFYGVAVLFSRRKKR